MGAVQIVCLQQRNGFLHRRRLIEQQPHGCGGGQAGLAGLLVDGGVILNHVDRHGQARSVHAVQWRIQRDERLNAVRQKGERNAWPPR